MVDKGLDSSLFMHLVSIYHGNLLLEFDILLFHTLQLPHPIIYFHLLSSRFRTTVFQAATNFILVPRFRIGVLLRPEFYEEHLFCLFSRCATLVYAFYCLCYLDVVDLVLQDPRMEPFSVPNMHISGLLHRFHDGRILAFVIFLLD